MSSLATVLVTTPTVPRSSSKCTGLGDYNHSLYNVWLTMTDSIGADFSFFFLGQSYLQCFDAVGWVAGRASGL